MYPKTISELNISSSGDSAGKNNIDVLTTTLPITNDSDTWKLGYKNVGDSFVKTDINTFASTAYFPTVTESRNVINNNLSLDISVTYETQDASTIIFYDKVTILCNGLTYTVTQDKINFIMKNELGETYFKTPVTRNINGTNYWVVEQTIIEVYNSTIDFKLAGTTNLSLMTPLLRSNVTKYFIYSIGTTFTGFTVGQPTTQSYTASNKVVTNLTQSVLEANSLKAFEIIRLYSDNTKLAVLNFKITKQTITSLNAQIQFRDDINDTTWENIGPIIYDIEPYLGSNPVLNKRRTRIYYYNGYKSKIRNKSNINN